MVQDQRMLLPLYTPELQQRDSEEEYVRKKVLLKEKVREAFLGGRGKSG